MALGISNANGPEVDPDIINRVMQRIHDATINSQNGEVIVLGQRSSWMLPSESSTSTWKRI
jgi:hypothetical protein